MATALPGAEYIRQQFQEHLQSIGFEFHGDDKIIYDKLRKRMGEQRFAELQKRNNGSHSAQHQEEIYHYFQDIIEGNLLRSLDDTATLDASLSVYQQMHTRLWDDMRVIELGCWTGGLASFVAKRHPMCTVVGVDFDRKIVNACRDFYRLPNLSFQEWNYRYGKPAALEPADVLLCSMGVVHKLPTNACSADPRRVRQTSEYLAQREHAAGYFSNWRGAAKPGGMLYAALRVRVLPRFVGWVDAARECGWRPRLEQFWPVHMASESHSIPGLVFEAAECDPLEEEAIIDAWARFSLNQELYVKLSDAAAFATFRGMEQRKVLAVRNYNATRVATRDEIGICGGTGYVFSSDAVSGFRLLLTSQRRAHALAEAVARRGCETPISDDGSLIESAASQSPPTTEHCGRQYASVFAGQKPSDGNSRN